MTVQQQAVATPIEPFHFNAAEFDALLEQNGTLAELAIAMQCPCLDLRTNRPDAACRNCYPDGLIYEAPIPITVHGPDRKGLRYRDQAGIVEAGAAYFTMPTGVRPARGSRLVLPLAEITVSDRLVRGKEERIRFAQVVAVEKAMTSRRVPPTGSYDVELVELVDGVDYVVSGRDVTWPNDTVADGAVVALRLRVKVEYLVAEVQDRNEDGKLMPFRYLCYRREYMLHPRGEKALSF